MFDYNGRELLFCVSDKWWPGWPPATGCYAAIGKSLCSTDAPKKLKVSRDFIHVCFRRAGLPALRDKVAL